MKKASCIFSIIICLFMSCMMPFSVSADALSAPFVGFNVNIIGFDAEYNQIQFPSISYGGNSSRATIQGQLNCSNPTVASTGCDVYELENQSGSQTGTGGLQITFLGVSDNINSFNATLSSQAITYLYEIEVVLDNTYVGWIKLHTGSDSSETIYVNGNSFSITRRSSAQNYTLTIDDYQLYKNATERWDFPIESFNFIGQMLSVNSSRLSGFDKYNQYTFPLFDIKQGDQVFKWRLGAGNELTMIFFSDLIINSATSINNAFTISSSDIEMEFVETLMYAHYTVNNKRGRLSKYTIRNNGSGLVDFTLNANMDFTIMPVYCNQEPYKAVSTDFALVFGLTNDFLDAVVYGTEQSNQSSSDLDDSSDNMNTQMQNLVTVEDGYNQQFNNSLQNIDFTSPTGNQNLLSSANFVITVFNGLIQNNFLSTLIIIICILIIGKKVIGK